MIDILLIIHYIGLSIGAGTSVYIAALGAYAGRTGDPAQIKSIMTGGAGMLSTVGIVGYVLLVISGGLLVWLSGMGPSLGWTFHIKVLLVVTLGVLIFYLRYLNIQAKREDGMATLGKMKKFGPFMLLLAFLIIVFAVLTFH